MDQPGDLDSIICGICNYEQNTKGIEKVVIVTRGCPSTFQSTLKDSSETLVDSAASINENCPQCGNPEMKFTTMQLRSADEGQTIFFNCIKCGHNHSVNS